jgi:hypothetical protein
MFRTAARAGSPVILIKSGKPITAHATKMIVTRLKAAR